MKKKIIILLIIILVLFAGFMTYKYYTNSTTIQVGNSIFTIPEGYHEGNLNEEGDICFTNTTTHFFIHAYNDTNINEHIQEYQLNKKKNNITAEIINYTINGILVYKYDNSNDKNFSHYWFIHNNQVYSIYTWMENPNIDSIVLELITTMK